MSKMNTEIKPFMSDEKIAQYASQYVQPNAREVKCACEHTRDVYEPELQRLTEGWRKAFNVAYDWQEKSKAQEVELVRLRELLQTTNDGSPQGTQENSVSSNVMTEGVHQEKMRLMLRDCEKWVEDMSEGKLLLKFDTIASKHNIDQTKK